MKHSLALAVALLIAAGGQAQTRRNSFVVDLLDVAQPRAGEQTVAVDHARWLFIRLDGLGTVALDGAAVLTGPGETMREVAAGEHRLRLTAQGNAPIGRLLVRSVPTVFAYMAEWHNTPSPTASYHHEKEFLERYLLPSCNIVVSNNNPAYQPDAAAWHAAGGRWMCNQGITTLRDPNADLVAFWRGILDQPMFDDVIHDEVLGQDPPHYQRWAETMPQALATLPGKRIWYWMPWGVLGEPDWANYFALDRAQPGAGQASLRCAASPDKLRTFRQADLELEAGATYTLSCLMRTAALTAQETPGTDGYDGANSGVFTINSGWFSTAGSLIPADRGGEKWQRFSKTFKAPTSRDGKYQVLVCPPAKGTMWVDELRLEPGATVGGGENLVTNGGFEQEWAGWPSPSHFDTLRRAVQDNDCRVAIEAYQNEAANEEAARQQIEGRLIGGVSSLVRGYEGFAPYVTVAFSGGNAPLRYSNDDHPDVNWKTNLDLQFHAAANSEAFEDIAGIGLWTLHYLDEEGVRWYGALYRHYLIEGSRERLAPWPYALDHLTNPGFEQGLDGWTTTGAVEVVDRKAAFGDRTLGSYAPVPQSNHVLAAQPGASFSQTIRSLKPGQGYALKVYVTDETWSKQDIVPQIAIEGAAPITGQDQHRRWTIDGKEFWSMDRRVFRASGETAKLTIGSASAGKVFWDFVQVEPYYEAE